MGKDYLEKSLKRFLKGKVKITLGLVVTFMITGTALFAEPVVEGNGVYIPANVWLNGIGKGETILSEDITLADGEIVLKAEDINNSSEYMGEKIKENIKKSISYIENSMNTEDSIDLGYQDNVGNSFTADEKGKYSVIEAGTTHTQTIQLKHDDITYVTGQLAENGGIVVNKGIIAVVTPNGKESSFGQQTYKGGIAINYGIIKNEGVGAQRGQNLYNYGILMNTDSHAQSGRNIFNYGIIANKGNRGQSGIVYNYGLIMNDGNEGQYIRNVGISGYNYGLIKNNGLKGQSIAEGGKGYNYGLINVKAQGQFAYSETSKTSYAYNYGIIDVEVESIQGQASAGQVAQDRSKIYNYGIIHSDKTAQNATMRSEAYNYGVLYNHEGNIMNTPNYGGTESSHNYGILITEGNTPFKNSGQADQLINNGIVLQRDGDKLTVLPSNWDNMGYGSAEKYVSGEIKSGTAESSKDVFINNLNNATTGVEIADELTNTHITTAVTTEVSDAIIKKDGDLTLNDSSIVGYFENNGTLLEVSGNLTLEGESVINAIAGNSYTGYNETENGALTDVVAVNLTNKGTLTLSENSKVLGMVKGDGAVVFKDNTESHNDGINTKLVYIETSKENGTDIKLSNVKISDLVIRGEETSKDNTKISLRNEINIGELRFNEHGTNGQLGADITLGDGQSDSDDTIKIESITLGTGNDIITINNKLSELGKIDGNGGKDTVILKNLVGNHDTFDYKLRDIDILDLNNQTWKIGDNADVSYSYYQNAKTTVQNGIINSNMKFELGETSTGTFEDKKAAFVLSELDFGDNGYLQIGIGAGSELEAGESYKTQNFNRVKEDYVKVAGIFDKTDTNILTVKTAEEMNIEDKYSGIYDEMLDNAKDNSEVLDVLNNSDASDIADSINKKGRMGETLGTTGYKITRDISNSFTSAVNEWGKKANKGEWLANAKYINSDVEYDGANDVKGYDSDIKSMVGMIEYGVSDAISYGIALGGGDTEVDVDGAGKLDGDNYYIGVYAKHSVNGFDLVGNLGYTISDLEVDGNGSADSSAITFGGYIKRNISLTDTVRLEPNFSFTYDYIMQDDAEGNGVKVNGKDIHVFEASAGMNIVKSFALENGLFEMKAGVKYSMADVNRNEETVISVYGIDGINLGNPEVDKTRGTAHIGFEYEHETGLGVNGKYETMWSDSGDDSRITAGVSYRF